MPAASKFKVLNFIQRGKTYFNVALSADGSDGKTLQELSDQYNLNISDAELNNKIVFTSDPNTVTHCYGVSLTGMTVHSDRPVNVNLLITDGFTKWPGDPIFQYNGD